MAPLMKNSATAQTVDSIVRSCGVNPNSETIAVPTSMDAIVSGLNANFCVKAAKTSPPNRPPTFAHTSTPAAEDAGKPKFATMFGVHLMMK
jgi:hypothetical protein